MSILKPKKLNDGFSDSRNRFGKDGHNRIKPPILQNEGYIQAIRILRSFFMRSFFLLKFQSFYPV